MTEVLYLDSSAKVKLVASEPESPALSARIADATTVLSEIARVEVLRAIRRSGGDREMLERGREVIRRVGLLRVDGRVLELAADVEPGDLRTLDAIHLASPLVVGDDLGAFVTYDRRLMAAGRAWGPVTEVEAGRVSAETPQLHAQILGA